MLIKSSVGVWDSKFNKFMLKSKIFAKSGNIESRNTDAFVFELDAGSRVDPKVVVAEDKECHNYSGSTNTKDSEDMVDGSDFAKRHFAERHLGERTFCRTDNLPKIEISSEL